jgi:acetyl esterase/lipase
MKTKFFISIILVMFSLGTASAQNNEQKFQDLLSQFKIEQITYKTVNAENLDMTMFFPNEKEFEKTPVVLYIHGGGWTGGNKYFIFKNTFFQTLRILTQNGIACATIDYRLTRQGISTIFDCVVDCKDAARFLIKNALKYGFDPNKISVLGGSAGGHLSLMTALGHNEDFIGDPELKSYDPQIKFVVSYFPVTTFMHSEYFNKKNTQDEQQIIEKLAGNNKNKDSFAKLISPANYISEEMPPVLIFHGDNDIIVPVEQSIFFDSIAKEKNANVKLVIVKRGGHGFKGENISPSIPQINQMAAEFILDHFHQ